MRYRQSRRVDCDTRQPILRLQAPRAKTGKGPNGEPGVASESAPFKLDCGSNQTVDREAFRREALIQRIVAQLRVCDPATLEAIACVLEPPASFKR